MTRAAVPLLLVAALALATPSPAHDIPNAQVDRSIQATIGPGLLSVDYEVSLAELTLTQDLRALIGSLPGADREEWFARYGRVVGPLDAKGLFVAVDGQPLEVHFRDFDLTVEAHPRFTFHFKVPIPSRGRLRIQDTNYSGSEGTSRLAIRGVGDIRVLGDDLPDDVRRIPIRPAWDLTDDEERRTTQVEVDYAPSAGLAVRPVDPQAPSTVATPSQPKAPDRLSRLLDRASGLPMAGLWVLAFGLGMAHAIQPGHGKTLVAASTIGDRAGWTRGVALAVVITAAHMAGVLAIAGVLWVTHATRYSAIHQSLAQVAGFVIAAIGLWRLGRHLAGYAEHDEGSGPAYLDARGLLGLGISGGLVPCWDAVALIVLAAAVGRLAMGLVLLAAFSLGMAAVLVIVGILAARLRGLATRWDDEGIWERRLGIASALVLTMIGLYLWGSFGGQ